MPAHSPNASPLEALRAGFRRACVRRLVGDESGAVQVLRDEIPGLVVAWAKTSPSDPSEKKAKLKEMFDDESSRANELAVAFDLFAGRFETRVAEMLRKEVSTLTHRIEKIGSGLSSAIQNIQSLSSKLQELGDGFNQSQSENIGRKGSHSTEEVIEPVCREPKVPSPISDQVNPVQNILPLPEPPCDSKAEEELIAPLPDKALESLDPPSGTGLRFDEIEEMIDEILSYESN
jgi:hypothetical protein